MYYYEKDYIMRLIHGIARVLARMFFNREPAEDGELIVVRDAAAAETNDVFRRMIDQGQINAAEDRLFELIDMAAWDPEQTAALIIAFYDYANSKDDEFLTEAGFSRDEIITGLEDALRRVGMEIPEYLRI